MFIIITTIITVNFYTLKTQSRNKQNHLANPTRGQAKVVIGAWNRRTFMVAISNKKRSVETKGVYSFRRFNRNRELIPNCWRSHIRMI